MPCMCAKHVSSDILADIFLESSYYPCVPLHRIIEEVSSHAKTGDRIPRLNYCTIYMTSISSNQLDCMVQSYKKDSWTLKC